MPTFSLMQVDAFTDRPLAGNPCAVVFDADPLDPDTMQAIAREMNLSETAFVQTTERADVRARYFTPAEEIPLAGHPTIATMFALVDTGRLSLDGRSTTVRLELPAGIVSIDLESQPDGSLQIVMAQRPPEFGKTYAADEVLPVFGLSEDDARSGVPVQTVSTGTPQLMIPVRALAFDVERKGAIGLRRGLSIERGSAPVGGDADGGYRGPLDPGLRAGRRSRGTRFVGIRHAAGDLRARGRVAIPIVAITMTAAAVAAGKGESQGQHADPKGRGNSRKARVHGEIHRESEVVRGTAKSNVNQSPDASGGEMPVNVGC